MIDERYPSADELREERDPTRPHGCTCSTCRRCFDRDNARCECFLRGIRLAVDAYRNDGTNPHVPSRGRPSTHRPP